MSATVTTPGLSHEVELKSGKKEEPVQFIFNDNSFIVWDLTEGTCISQELSYLT